MSSKAYIRNPKDPGGNRNLCAQDEEDFEQEQAIKAWLEREGRDESFEFAHINRKGKPRNTLVRAQIRLDAQIREDESGTFADLIAGSDGRDLGSESAFGATSFQSEISEIDLLVELFIAQMPEKCREEIRGIYMTYLEGFL